MKRADAKIEQLRAAFLFSLLNDAQLQAVADISVPIAHSVGDVIFYEDDEGDSLLIISKGAVKITKCTEDGRQKILAILFEGDLLGEMAVLGEHRRSGTVECLENCELLVIPGSDFRDLLKKDFETTLRLLSILTKRLRETDDQLVDTTCRGAKERLRAMLCDLAVKRGKRTQKGWLIEVQLTHEELAACLGVSRETVTRILGALADDGIIGYSGRRILVLKDGADVGRGA